MSARTRSSHGTNDLSHPNARPLRQAIVLVPCEEHGDHVIMLSGWKAEDVDSCADFIASSMAAAGHTATVQSHTAHNALQDYSHRHPGFADLLAHIKARVNEGDGAFHGPGDEGPELPF